MPRLIMLIGLPGSGKSTYAQQLCGKNSKLIYCSSDAIRKELYGDESIQTDNNKVFRILHHRVKNYIQLGFDVIYDATNVTRKNRKIIIEYCKDIATVEGHVVWAPIEECIKRDKDRDRTVGSDVIRKFLYRWQSPNYDEGFDSLYITYNIDNFSSETYIKQCLTDMDIPHDNPHHKLSVLNHCISVKYYCLSHFKETILTEAAIYHDIGKPLTKFFKEQDNVAHYYQHDNVGGYMVYGCCANKPMDEVILISWIVCNHMQPFFKSNYYNNLSQKYKELLDNLHEADTTNP